MQLTFISLFLQRFQFAFLIQTLLTNLEIVSIFKWGPHSIWLAFSFQNWGSQIVRKPILSIWWVSWYSIASSLSQTSGCSPFSKSPELYSILLRALSLDLWGTWFIFRISISKWIFLGYRGCAICWSKVWQCRDQKSHPHLGCTSNSDRLSFWIWTYFALFMKYL